MKTFSRASAPGRGQHSKIDIRCYLRGRASVIFLPRSVERVRVYRRYSRRDKSDRIILRTRLHSIIRPVHDAPRDTIA
jgi:hypothetical protein